MKDFIAYFTSGKPLEEREQLLFELVNLLDNESFNLFNEIINLNDSSYYKIENLTTRINELKELNIQINKAFEYIKKIEESGYDYATRRLQFSRLAVAITTVYSCMINFILGIFHYIILNRMVNERFANELEETNQKIRQFDEDKITTINNTLDNCTRLLKGKMHKIQEHNFDLFDIIANDYITQYLEGNAKNIEYLPDNLQIKIREMLQIDLNTNNDNLDDLLSSTKDNSGKVLKLIKEYEDKI